MSLDNILLATDGSAYSVAAEALALELASLHSSKLTVVRAVAVNDEFLALAPNAVRDLEK